MEWPKGDVVGMASHEHNGATFSAFVRVCMTTVQFTTFTTVMRIDSTTTTQQLLTRVCRDAQSRLNIPVKPSQSSLAYTYRSHTGEALFEAIGLDCVLVDVPYVRHVLCTHRDLTLYLVPAGESRSSSVSLMDGGGDTMDARAGETSLSDSTVSSPQEIVQQVGVADNEGGSRLLSVPPISSKESGTQTVSSAELLAKHRAKFAPTTHHIFEDVAPLPSNYKLPQIKFIEDEIEDDTAQREQADVPPAAASPPTACFVVHPLLDSHITTVANLL